MENVDADTSRLRYKLDYSSRSKDKVFMKRKEITVPDTLHLFPRDTIRIRYWIEKLALSLYDHRKKSELFRDTMQTFVKDNGRYLDHISFKNKEFFEVKDVWGNRSNIEVKFDVDKVLSSLLRNDMTTECVNRRNEYDWMSYDY